LEKGSFTQSRKGRKGSVLIGCVPQSGPKKHDCFCGIVEYGAAEDRSFIGAYCPQGSVVMGDVSDIGESAWSLTRAPG
jgi:hypothetical protein